MGFLLSLIVEVIFPGRSKFFNLCLMLWSLCRQFILPWLIGLQVPLELCWFSRGKVQITPLKFSICPYYPLNLHLVQFTPSNYFSWSSLPRNKICYFCFSIYSLSLNINFCDTIENIISYVRKIYLNFLPPFW